MIRNARAHTTWAPCLAVAIQAVEDRAVLADAEPAQLLEVLVLRSRPSVSEHQAQVKQGARNL